MFCSNCGFDNADDDDARFCASCGSPLEPSEGEVTEVSDGGFSVDRLGPYELRGELGRGAMARVWRAYDPNLGREVAIKEPMFDQNLSQDVRDEMGRRFVREAKTAARLNHPGIVTIYAADVYEGNRPAIVMELVEGATLGEILNRERKLDPATSLDVLNQLLDAVGYAHAQGVVHRDIKPDNIFVSSDGRVELADFGIARVEDDHSTRATQMGTVLGTPGYMSPEQARGALVDSRSDLFSIGVVGYEMLSGRNPFGAGDGSDSTTLLYRIVHEPADELPEAAAAGLPADIRPAIMAALAKNPNDRPQTAEEFKAMLRGDAAAPIPYSGESTLKEVAQKSERSGSRPKWLPYAAVTAVCVVAVAIVFVMATKGGQPGPSPSPSPSPTAATTAASTGAASSTTTTTTTTNGLAYLAEHDGKIAIYSNSSATPYKETDILTSDLTDDEKAKLKDHISCASVEEAEVKANEYRDSIQKRKAAEEEQKRLEEERLQKEREEKTWYVCANDFVTLRSSPSTRANAIVRIGVREPVEYIGSVGGGWAQVNYNGSSGYVLEKFISHDPNAPLVYDDV